MSKFVSTTFGYISGRHGTAIASVTKDGKNLLRVYRAPSNPNTPRQQAQRLKFSLVSKGMAPLYQIMRLGYREPGSFRKATGLALKEAVTGVAPDFKLDFSKVQIADGNLQSVAQVDASVTEGTSVTVTWDTTLGYQKKEGRNDDAVNLVFFNQATGLSIPFLEVANREAGTVSVSLPAIWIDAKVHCWIFLTSADALLGSPSVYVKEVQL